MNEIRKEWYTNQPNQAATLQKLNTVTSHILHIVYQAESYFASRLEELCGLPPHLTTLNTII